MNNRLASGQAAAAGLPLFAAPSGRSDYNGAPMKSRVIVPTSIEQRRALVDTVSATVGSQIVDLCNEIAATDREKTVRVLGIPLSTEVEGALLDLMNGELGYRLELNEAVKSELLTGELMAVVKPTRDMPGVQGSVSTAFEKSAIWGEGGNVDVHYFVAFAKYPRVEAAGRQAAMARRRLEDLIESGSKK